MTKFIIIILVLVSLSIYGWKMLSVSNEPIADSERENVEENAANTLTTQNTAPENDRLYKLKSSINHIVDDSVQEEIQQAVQEELLKTQGSD